MAIGDRIREARKNKKLTQEQLGKIIGVAKSTVAGYEGGTSSPDVSKINAMIKALDVDANFLYQDEIDISMYSSSPINHTTDESKQIEQKYNLLDEKYKKFIDKQIKDLLEMQDNRE